MKNTMISKYIAVGLIFSFLLFYCPYFLTAQADEKGKLIGIVYGKDGTTPIEGAVVQLRNVGDRTVYKSDRSNFRGAFEIEGIKEGLYVAGISTPTMNFNTSNIIGIKNGETTKIYFSLFPPQEKKPSHVTEDFPPKNEIRVGRVIKFYIEEGKKKAWIYMEEGTLRVGDNIRILGIEEIKDVEETDFYQKIEEMFIDSEKVEKVIAGQTFIIELEEPAVVGDFVYYVKKKKFFLAFFLEPCGLALLIAGTTAIIYTVREYEEEEPVSPFKNK